MKEIFRKDDCKTVEMLSAIFLVRLESLVRKRKEEGSGEKN